MALALARRATTSFHVSHDGEASTSGSPLDLDSVEAMLSHSLFAAVKIGDVKTVAAMVERGLHKDNAGDDRRCPRGATALHHAAGYGHVDVVRLLVERGGAELNSLCEIAGGTPLIWVRSLPQNAAAGLIDAVSAPSCVLTTGGATAGGEPEPQGSRDSPPRVRSRPRAASGPFDAERDVGPKGALRFPGEPFGR